MINSPATNNYSGGCEGLKVGATSGRLGDDASPGIVYGEIDAPIKYTCLACFYPAQIEYVFLYTILNI